MAQAAASFETADVSVPHRRVNPACCEHFSWTLVPVLPEVPRLRVSPHVWPGHSTQAGVMWLLWVNRHGSRNASSVEYDMADWFVLTQIGCTCYFVLVFFCRVTLIVRILRLATSNVGFSRISMIDLFTLSVIEAWHQSDQTRQAIVMSIRMFEDHCPTLSCFRWLYYFT